MSVYFVKNKGWRYDFLLKGLRNTQCGFRTKKEAKQAEANKREEIQNPPKNQEAPTDMDFLELINFRLDHVQACHSLRHFQEYRYMAKRWVKMWGKLPCSEIAQSMIERFVWKRGKISAYTANKEIRYLRATFNYGNKRKFISTNPLIDIEFLPVEKRVKYVPSPADIDKVIAMADSGTREYLWTIRETMGRKSEIDRLTWEDIDFQRRELVLYTRKKRGGHLTPRKVPMTNQLFEILSGRHRKRDPDKPWVFWHRYWSRKDNRFVEGPYNDRKKIMKTLCAKAEVRYFRFHALRHAGASVMESLNVPIGSIQRILGHENRTTTEIYLHSIGDSERRAMAVYELSREKSHTNSHT